MALQHFLSLINTYLLEVHVIQVGRNPSVYKAGAVDGYSLMMAIIEMSRAFGESERKGILVSAAWQEQRERGQPVGKKGGKPMGRNPSWLEWQPSGTWREIPERVEVVKRIFDLSMNARLGRCELAVRLCQEKAHCWNRAGNWTASSVQQILINPAVTGRLDPRRSNNPRAEAVEDYYPRIISDEMFLEAQRISSARRLGGGRPVPIYPEALLTGIIWAKARLRQTQRRAVPANLLHRALNRLQRQIRIQSLPRRPQPRNQHHLQKRFLQLAANCSKRAIQLLK